MNNGVCDQDIIGDHDCLFDYPDCTDELVKLEECNFAVQQSYLGCEIALEMALRYPECEKIQLCCQDFNLTKNGICDTEIMNDFDCNYDLPDCTKKHQEKSTCPFLELHNQLSCEIATDILKDFPTCQNLRLCCT